MSTRRDPYEKALTLFLRADAFLLLTALIPSMMPYAWMKDVHRWLGMGELPAEPIVGYLARSLSVMYALHGATLLFVSVDVRGFLPVVRFLAVLGIAFGLWMTAMDIAVGMPVFWVAGEGPVILLVHCVFFWLSGRVAGQ